MVQTANIGGNHYDKYASGNPIARALMNGFFGAFDDLVGRAAPTTAFEIGCGEGELTRRLLARGIDARGFDLEAETIAEAHARDPQRADRYTVGSIYDLADGEIAADLVVCCEVLEHLPDPVRGLERLAAQSGVHFLVSVPREPLWRVLNLARGKYIGDLGNTPGHLNHWGQRGFLDFIGTQFEVVEMRSPLPWTMALCRKR